ncbi:MAG TPA: DUF1800 family protein [Phenylobacterium sp.]|uniref:DUF1800 domain-containing protein n=1 Tax=Phenylobacterium sp. TaxID=1871053 RepID=UPI002C8A2502|nr:DUF1800 family protein [Phenylobacterium sp.]HSV03126.1 DUF1800 family protein [Phenylobacterium sp.]
MAIPDRELAGALAVTRFGLGARSGEIAEAARDPRGWLKAQVRPEGADLFPTGGETAARRVADLREFQQARKMARRDAVGDQQSAADARDPVKLAQKMLRQDTAGDFLARTQLAATTPAGFRERWALFWANHFTVAANKLQTATVVGPFETEAIRPHVFGRFQDLLIAAETHPAMLLYLDQVQSVGPDSPFAQRMAQGGRPGLGARLQPVAQRTLGLNENLAREIMELHTVGVRGGYSQADVTEFARAMTGLSIGGFRGPDGEIGEPVFRLAAHEPGERTVMGVRYRPGGREQAAAILADLAAKPQTARFVCGKIARHFVADAPSPALTARLEKAWTGSGGDLSQVAEALIAAPEAWDPNPAKFKTPYEFLVSSYRAAGAAPQAISQVAPILTALGQKPFTPGSPKGWPEDAGAWAAPDAVVKRMQFAQGFAAQATQGRDPKELAAQALGPRLSPATATAIARAESRPEGFALLLMSPEFQRR